MAEIIVLGKKSVEPTYGVRLLARCLESNGMRTVTSFYADTSDEEEVGDLHFPTAEALVNWLQDLSAIERSPALEIVSRLRGGEFIVLHDPFTKAELLSVGMVFRPFI